MSQFRSGNGGYIEVSADAGVTWVQINVGTWTLGDMVRDVENTHSGTGGATNYEAVVSDPTSRIEGPWDESAVPDAVGKLVKGTKPGIRFKLGGGAIKKTLTGALCMGVEFVCNNQGDIVRWSSNTKGGVTS